MTEAMAGELPNIPEAQVFFFRAIPNERVQREIPVDALARLKRMQAYDINGRAGAPLEGFLVMPRVNGSKTFVATSGTFEEGQKSPHSAYFVDTLGNEVLGYGEVIYSVPLHQKGEGRKTIRVMRPYVVWEETFKEHQKEGWGMQRLRDMNAFCMRTYNMSLSSGPRLPKAAEDLWIALVAEGEAEEASPPGATSKWYQFVRTEVRKKK